MTDPLARPSVAGAGVARAAAIAGLGLRGPLSPHETEVVASAREDDPDARVRAAALAALARSAPPDVARSHWLDACTDAEATVRRRAAELAPLLARRDSAVFARLSSILGDTDVTVVEAAAWALGELGADAVAHGAVEPLLTTARDHRDPLAREAAVAALGALGDPAALPTILHACTDRPAVRRRAVLALAPFEGAEVDAAIANALTDNDWQVRQAAEDLQRGDQAPESESWAEPES